MFWHDDIGPNLEAVFLSFLVQNPKESVGHTRKKMRPSPVDTERQLVGVAGKVPGFSPLPVLHHPNITDTLL